MALPEESMSEIERSLLMFFEEVLNTSNNSNDLTRSWVVSLSIFLCTNVSQFSNFLSELMKKY